MEQTQNIPSLQTEQLSPSTLIYWGDKYNIYLYVSFQSDRVCTCVVWRLNCLRLIPDELLGLVWNLNIGLIVDTDICIQKNTPNTTRYQSPDNIESKRVQYRDILSKMGFSGPVDEHERHSLFYRWISYITPVSTRNEVYETVTTMQGLATPAQTSQPIYSSAVWPTNRSTLTKAK